MDSQEWDRRYAGAELVWTAEPNRFVVAELQDLAPGRALDVAAGEGRNAVWLASRGWQVTAVDFSAAGLDKGRRLAQARGVTIDWMHADVRDYQPETGVFQLEGGTRITGTGCLEEDEPRFVAWESGIRQIDMASGGRQSPE